MLTVPAAFNDTTGAAHWEVLLRARAIETGCFVLAPAQCGAHPTHCDPDRRRRRSHGHSLAVGPWGECWPMAARNPASPSSRLTPVRSMGHGPASRR